jgi:hypothetical protein
MARIDEEENLPTLVRELEEDGGHGRIEQPVGSRRNSTTRRARYDQLVLKGQTPGAQEKRWWVLLD